MKDVSLNYQTGASAVRLAKSDPLMFGSSLADVFSAPAYDCRVFGQEQKPEFAVTRLRSGPRENIIIQQTRARKYVARQKFL